MFFGIYRGSEATDGRRCIDCDGVITPLGEARHPPCKKMGNAVQATAAQPTCNLQGSSREGVGKKGGEKVKVIEKKYEVLREDKRTKAELKKLNNIFKAMPEDKKALAEKLIGNAAFMAILLDDLQEDIKENGYKEEYKNGENQYGYKRSIAADLYQVTIKNYSNTIKQLNDLLPKESPEEDDCFDEFINRLV